MESKIFAKLNFDPGILVIASIVISVVLIVIVLLLLLRQSRLEMNYKIFMKGRGGRSLQEVFKQQLEGIDIVKEQTDLLHRRLSYVEKSLNRSFQKCGIVKYDAFKEIGGQLSFAMAMLNDSNTGFIINCIHSRDGSYTYIKDIVRGECAAELCDEEKQALKIALEAAGSNPSLTKSEKKGLRRFTNSGRSEDETSGNTVTQDYIPVKNNSSDSTGGSADSQDIIKIADTAAEAEHVRKRRHASVRSAGVKQAVINKENDKA